MRVLALCLLLLACGHPPTPHPVGVTLKPNVRVSAAAKGEPEAAPVSRAIRAYRRAEKTVPKAVVHPEATAEQIREIYEKELAAHRAVQVLIDQSPHPTPDALKAANDATQELIRAQQSEIFSTGRWPSSGPESK